MVIIQEETFEKARKEISKLNEEKEIVFTSNDDDLNTKILEKEKISILLLNQKSRKDFQKQRNSGFNQVMAKLAKKNKVKIGINLDELIQTTNLKEKSEILARIKQNIKLCNKNNLQMKFIVQEQENQRNPHDLKALGSVLGMSTNMTKSLF